MRKKKSAKHISVDWTLLFLNRVFHDAGGNWDAATGWWLIHSLRVPFSHCISVGHTRAYLSHVSGAERCVHGIMRPNCSSFGSTAKRFRNYDSVCLFVCMHFHELCTDHAQSYKLFYFIEPKACPCSKEMPSILRCNAMQWTPIRYDWECIVFFVLFLSSVYLSCSAVDTASDGGHRLIVYDNNWSALFMTF